MKLKSLIGLLEQMDQDADVAVCVERDEGDDVPAVVVDVAEAGKVVLVCVSP